MASTFDHIISPFGDLGPMAPTAQTPHLQQRRRYLLQPLYDSHLSKHHRPMRDLGTGDSSSFSPIADALGRAAPSQAYTMQHTSQSHACTGSAHGQWRSILILIQMHTFSVTFSRLKSEDVTTASLRDSISSVMRRKTRVRASTPGDLSHAWVIN